jgi:hypothetical protein
VVYSIYSLHSINGRRKDCDATIDAMKTYRWYHHLSKHIYVFLYLSGRLKRPDPLAGFDYLPISQTSPAIAR